MLNYGCHNTNLILDELIELPFNENETRVVEALEEGAALLVVARLHQPQEHVHGIVVVHFITEG